MLTRDGCAVNEVSMNPEFDKEIDSLLRRNARLAAAGARSVGTTRAPRDSSHLDADELSAFAEGSLPAAARTFAASHLADCDECRTVVVRLSSASDVAGEIEKRDATVVPVEAAKVPWWRTLLGAAFAPGVLRYATPVLVLGLVGVVSFIALRSNKGSVPETVHQPSGDARNGVVSAPASNANTATTDSLSSATQNSATTPSFDASKQAAPTASAAEEASVVQPSQPKAADKDVAPGELAEPVVVTSKGAGPGAAGGGTESKEKADALASAPAPAPPPAKAAASETTEPQKAAGEDARRNRAAEPEQGYVLNERAQQTENRAANQMRKQEVQMPDDSARNDSRGNIINNRGNVGGVSAAPSRAQRPAAKRGRSEDNKARDAGEDDEVARVDTRSAAGHRFRREGGAWVDVNYKSSMSMTGVRRGTDAYRALVADIPELGRIAEQIGGEVIAVVKGRAYRIR